MSKMKSAIKAVLKREPWSVMLVITINVGLQYWRNGQVSPINWFGILFGILLVAVVAVLGEMYWTGKSKSKSKSKSK